MLPLPHKSSSRSIICCACHTNLKPSMSKRAPRPPIESNRLLHLPHESSSRSVNPAIAATRKQPWPSDAQAPTNTSQRVKLLRLPHNSSSRSSRFCLSPAKAAPGAPNDPNVVLATRNQPRPSAVQEPNGTPQRVKLLHLPHENSSGSKLSEFSCVG